MGKGWSTVCYCCMRQVYGINSIHPNPKISNLSRNLGAICLIGSYRSLIDNTPAASRMSRVSTPEVQRYASHTSIQLETYSPYVQENRGKNVVTTQQDALVYLSLMSLVLTFAAKISITISKNQSKRQSIRQANHKNRSCHKGDH